MTGTSCVPTNGTPPPPLHLAFGASVLHCIALQHVVLCNGIRQESCTRKRSTIFQILSATAIVDDNEWSPPLIPHAGRLSECARGHLRSNKLRQCHPHEAPYRVIIESTREAEIERYIVQTVVDLAVLEQLGHVFQPFLRTGIGGNAGVGQQCIH